MRIALIWPHDHTVYQTLPLSLGILYSTIRDQGHVVRIFNLPLEGWTAASPEFHQAISAFQPELIGVSAWAVSFRSAVAAMRAARKHAPDAITLCGGMYATLNAEVAWSAGVFDYLVLGEAERTFPELVRRLAAGDREGVLTLAGIYHRKSDGTLVHNKPVLQSDLDSVARVDWEFIQLDRAFERGYMATVLGPRRKVAMFATRGCQYACNFCAAPLLNGQGLRHWSVRFVTDEIRTLYDRYGVRMIYFMDDNATQDRAFFKDLCRGIAAMSFADLTIELYRGVRLENLDPEMVALMKDAGFRSLTIAPESGSERVRKLMKKDMDDADIRRAARLIREAGLSLQAYFIVGYPGETREERVESYRMIYELGLDVFSLHKYMALPGTGSFRKLVKDGKISRDYLSESHFIGEDQPNFNGDLPKDIDREILNQYVRFYARYPWKIVHLLRMASVGGLTRAIKGTVHSGLLSLMGRSTEGVLSPSIREPM